MARRPSGNVGVERRGRAGEPAVVEMRDIHRNRARCAMAMVCAWLMTGCISTQEYPPEWPAQKPEQASRCPDISGFYVNIADTLEPIAQETSPEKPVPGQLVPPKPEPVPKRVVTCHADESGWVDPPCFLSVLFSASYTDYLFRSRLKYRDVEDHADFLAEIAQAKNGSFVVYIVNTKNSAIINVYRHDLNDGRLACEDGAYKWSYSASEGYGGYGLVIGSIAHTLRPTVDGSLVLEARLTAGGLILVFPAVGRTTLWYRWPKYEAR